MKVSTCHEWSSDILFKDIAVLVLPFIVGIVFHNLKPLLDGTQYATDCGALITVLQIPACM